MICSDCQMLNIAAASSSEMRPMSSFSRSESCETNSLRFGSKTLRQRWVAEDKMWVFLEDMFSFPFFSLVCMGCENVRMLERG